MKVGVTPDTEQVMRDNTTQYLQMISTTDHTAHTSLESDLGTYL